MAVEAVFDDGTKVRLTIWPPCCLLSHGFEGVLGPCATVTAARRAPPAGRRWLRPAGPDAKEAPARVEEIVIECAIYRSSEELERVEAGDRVRARDVRQACKQVPWPERPGEPSALRGVGFRATVRHGAEERVLHDHWGDGYAFPPDFRSARYAAAGWMHRAEADLGRPQQAPVR